MKQLAFASFTALTLSSCWNFNADLAECQKSGDCLTAAPPTLIASNPAHDSTDVAITTDFTLFFSEPMRTGSVVLTISPPVALKPAVFEEDGMSGVFEPLAQLSFSQLYTVSVSGKDIDGNDMTPASFSFTTQAAPDMTSPTLISTVPSNGLNNVAVTAKLILTFSEAIDPSSLSLENTAPQFDWGVGTAEWSTDARTVTLTPPQPMQGETMYVVPIAARDMAQNPLMGTNSVAFTTAKAPDTVPPEVVATAPLADAMMVSPNVSPSVTFSEAMDAAVMASSYFTIAPSVTCNFMWDPSTTTLTCSHPGQPLLMPNTAYTVTIGTSAKDKAGVALAAPFSFTFTTGMMQDTTPPTVMSTDPADGGTGVQACANIAVTFSESMDKTETQNAFSISSPAGVTGSFTWSSNTMTFNPSSNFAANQQVSWQIGTGAKDLANQNLAGTASFNFRVAKTTGPTTIYASNKSGYVYRTTNGSNSGVSSASNTSMYVGDIPSGSSIYGYRSFLDFDLSSIPVTASIISATLYVYQKTVAGTPYGASGFGSLVLDPMDYGMALTAGAFSQTELKVVGYCPPCSLVICSRLFGATVLSSSATLGWKTTQVRDELQGALEKQRRLQLRLNFSTKGTDGDATSDLVTFHSPASTMTTCTGEPTDNPTNQCKPFLRVSYTYP